MISDLTTYCSVFPTDSLTIALELQQESCCHVWLCFVDLSISTMSLELHRSRAFGITKLGHTPPCTFKRINRAELGWAWRSSRIISSRCCPHNLSRNNGHSLAPQLMLSSLALCIHASYSPATQTRIASHLKRCWALLQPAPGLAPCASSFLCGLCTPVMVTT